MLRSVVARAALPRASRSRVSSQIGDQLVLGTQQAIDAPRGKPEQAEEEQGAELDQNARLVTVTLRAGGVLAKSIVLLSDDVRRQRADLVRRLLAAIRALEDGGGIPLLPDADGLRPIVKFGGDQRGQACAILGVGGLRPAEYLLSRCDLRQGLVVSSQVTRVAGQQVSCLAGFRVLEARHQFLGLRDEQP